MQRVRGPLMRMMQTAARPKPDAAAKIVSGYKLEPQTKALFGRLLAGQQLRPSRTA